MQGNIKLCAKIDHFENHNIAHDVDDLTILKPWKMNSREKKYTQIKYPTSLLSSFDDRKF